MIRDLSRLRARPPDPENCLESLHGLFSGRRWIRQLSRGAPCLAARATRRNFPQFAVPRPG